MFIESSAKGKPLELTLAKPEDFRSVAAIPRAETASAGNVRWAEGPFQCGFGGDRIRW